MRPFSQPFLTISKPEIRTCVNLEIFVQFCQVIHLLLSSFSFFSFIFFISKLSVALLIRPSTIIRKFRCFIQKNHENENGALSNFAFTVFLCTYEVFLFAKSTVFLCMRCFYYNSLYFYVLMKCFYWQNSLKMLFILSKLIYKGY